MDYVIECENIKCGGCANTIESKINKIAGVKNVVIEIEKGNVFVEAEAGLRDQLITVLMKAGYPEKGSVKGI